MTARGQRAVTSEGQVLHHLITSRSKRPKLQTAEITDMTVVVRVRVSAVLLSRRLRDGSPIATTSFHFPSWEAQAPPFCPTGSVSRPRRWYAHKGIG